MRIGELAPAAIDAMSDAALASAAGTAVSARRLDAAALAELGFCAGAASVCTAWITDLPDCSAAALHALWRRPPSGRSIGCQPNVLASALLARLAAWQPSSAGGTGNATSQPLFWGPVWLVAARRDHAIDFDGRDWARLFSPPCVALEACGREHPVRQVPAAAATLDAWRAQGAARGVCVAALPAPDTDALSIVYIASESALFGKNDEAARLLTLVAARTKSLGSIPAAPRGSVWIVRADAQGHVQPFTTADYAALVAALQKPAQPATAAARRAGAGIRRFDLDWAL
jgi:hypothetical protein